MTNKENLKKVIEKKEVENSNKNPKYATRKLSVGLVSCMLGYALLVSPTEVKAEEDINAETTTEEDKAPYEGSVGDIPDNLDYQSEYAEKLEASRKLEAAKEKAKKALKAAGIESDFYAKYIDKANTIEGIEAYVKEVIGAHTDSVVTSAEEDEDDFSYADLTSGSEDSENIVVGEGGNDTSYQDLTSGSEDSENIVVGEGGEDTSYQDLTSGSEDSENIVVGEGGEDTSYQDLTDNPGNAIEIKDSITVTHEDGTKTVITADDDKARETIAKNPEKVKSMVEDVKEDTKATKEDTSKTETKKVAVAKSNNPKTGVVGSIGVASILAAASAGLAVSKKRK
ncbi:albumin-binding GA domain-containing protein [Anaerococcus sp. AGMB09787]|uniref:albumin-binding GA domain-containing protein n=1 Tax=Anaerococcus sp. AGMB09787 TaxID=2922869 RepID=UPI001FAF4991|nr:albumin-binding GA domain-containing protein [Anaerococcus sp. AGMB09787]